MSKVPKIAVVALGSLIMALGSGMAVAARATALEPAKKPVGVCTLLTTAEISEQGGRTFSVNGTESGSGGCSWSSPSEVVNHTGTSELLFDLSVFRFPSKNTASLGYRVAISGQHAEKVHNIGKKAAFVSEDGGLTTFLYVVVSGKSYIELEASADIPTNPLGKAQLVALAELVLDRIQRPSA
jgi:hypothetical protein